VIVKNEARICNILPLSSKLQQNDSAQKVSIPKKFAEALRKSYETENEQGAGRLLKSRGSKKYEEEESD
jgi:hypothetical protein